jgi:hypothetical protein
MKDLAPEIYRQRAVIEGYPNHALESQEIKDYLSQMSVVLGMKVLMDPITHRSSKYGEAAWIHWESSGAHFYAWDQPRLFFSVDLYTCKAFDLKDAIDFTKKYFQIDSVEAKDF